MNLPITVVEFLLRFFKVEAQSGVGCFRFLVSLMIMLLGLPSLDLTAENGRVDIKCHLQTDEVVIRKCLSSYSFISPRLLAWITASLVFVLWSTIIFYSAKQLPKIKRMTDNRKKKALCREFWKNFFRHVCCEAVVIAVSLAYLCYTQKMSTFYCPLKNDVTCSIEQHWDNPVNVIIGGMGFIWVLCMLTIRDALYNKEAFIKDLVNAPTGRKKRKRWTHAENVKVMECYYESKLSIDLGYMQRMHDSWINKGMEVLPKKRLADQARSILKNKLLSEDELKEIRDRVGFQEEDRCVIC